MNPEQEQQVFPRKTYKPNAKELVITCDPDDVKVTNIAFVVRVATFQDKVKYVLRTLREMEPNEQADKLTLREFFKNPEIYLCIEEDEVTMMKGEFILSKASDEIEEPDTSNI